MILLRKILCLIGRHSWINEVEYYIQQFLIQVDGGKWALKERPTSRHIVKCKHCGRVNL